MKFSNLWYIKQYKKPYLNICKANIMAKKDCDILIDDNDFELDIALDTQQNRDILHSQLHQMTDARHPIWVEIFSSTVSEILLELLDALYVAGYLWDAGQPDAVNITEVDKLNKTSDYYFNKFLLFFHQCNDQDKAALTLTIDHLFGETFGLLSSGNIVRHSIAVTPVSNIWNQDNFYLITLVLQLGYIQRNNPVALLLVAKFLLKCHSAGLFGQQAYSQGSRIDASSMNQAMLDETMADFTSNVYSIRDAEAALFAFSDSLPRTVADNALRQATPHIDIDDSQTEGFSGINFALSSENYARQCSVALGGSKFLQALQEPDNHALLAPACYLQEYFVNYRFVETITPMITKRLTPKFKQMFWRYYDEEIGHEKYELETCKKLGLTEQYISDNLPLPLTQAFCDAYSYLSENETTGYLAAVMVTEGVPGEPSLINNILAQSKVLAEDFNEASAEHEQLNQELGHQFLSRIFLAEIDFISNKHQRKALNILSYMIELNFRAWEDLYERLIVDQKSYLEDSYSA